MVFSSITFILYFLPAFLVLYYVTPSKYRNITLLLGSIFFYAWELQIHLCYNWHHYNRLCGNQYNALRKRGNVQKGLLALSVSINLALLFYFKYANFFVDNLNVFLGTFSENQMRLGTVLLPIGISFYTFESITYSVDIYRGIHKPLKRFTDYLLYILLFRNL